MVLFALAGFAGSKFLGIELALPVAVFLGLFIAPLIPAKTACSVPAAERDAGGKH